jgi:acyl-coenzyme A thioesterase PaaI-like protein
MTSTPTAAFRQDVADCVLSLPVAAAFGLSFDELTSGRAITRLRWRPEHSHAPGAFQASPIARLADFTGAAATLLPPGWSLGTVDYTVKFLTEARGEQLLARGRVLRPGSTLTVASSMCSPSITAAKRSAPPRSSRSATSPRP